MPNAKKSTSCQAISVIIAAKNEEANLPRLLDSISKLSYPPDKYEIILVNDHSTDATLQIAQGYKLSCPYKVLDFSTAIDNLVGKKAAIQYGINHSRYGILAFTDADCELPPTWLEAINDGFDNETDYLLGYSIMKTKPGATSFRLKNFERSIYYALAAMGMRIRKPITSSACNMAYRKQVLEQSGGFEGIGHLRSGDDDLLLMKMMPHIRQAVFSSAPQLVVTSYDGTDSKAHHHTNIRRASKFRYFPLYLKALAAIVFAYFLLFYYLLVSGLVSPASVEGSMSLLGTANPVWAMIASKTAIELLFCVVVLAKVRQIRLILLYPLQILYFPLQFLFFAVWGSLGKYSWK